MIMIPTVEFENLGKIVAFCKSALYLHHENKLCVNIYGLFFQGGVIFNSLVNQSGQGSAAPHFFKPVSVFATWSLMQIVNNTIAKARERNVYAGTADYDWVKYYQNKLTSDATYLKVSI